MNRLSLTALALLAFSNVAFAQTYPIRPIRLLVGFPVGVGSDTTARTVAQKLPEQLGQPVVVENRTGAAGMIAAERLVASPADGYTLLMMTGSETFRPAMRAKMPYDLVRDFAPVSMVASTTYLLLLHPSVPARNVKELIALARARPGALNYGSTGVGSSSHLAGELFNTLAKVNIVQIAYKGSTESATATAAGQVDMSYGTIVAVMPLVSAGRLKAIAVTGAARSALMPAVPTLDESGLPGYERSVWFGVVAPAGVPKEIVTRLNSAIVAGVNTRDAKEGLNKLGIEVQTGTPEHFATLIRKDIEVNTRIIKAAGIKPE
jgi:tripartite-type tricarboxylate transporter receptor subunit TctC